MGKAFPLDSLSAELGTAIRHLVMTDAFLIRQIVCSRKQKMKPSAVASFRLLACRLLASVRLCVVILSKQTERLCLFSFEQVITG